MDNSEDYQIINRLNGGFAKHHLGFVMSQPNVNQENAIMVGMADMEFKLAPKVYEKLLAKLGTPHFGYTWIKPSFSSTLEAWIRKRYYPEAQIKQDNVIAWVNLFQCYNCILNIITEPNDNLLFITPSYYRFIFQANFLGRKCLEAQLKMKDGTF
jgi:cystathionine beta-lyase